MEDGEQHSQTAYLCLLSLIRAQLAGSRVWLWSCSHMPTVMTPTLLFALFCCSFFCCASLLSVTFPHDISSHKHKGRHLLLRPYFTGCTAWIAHLCWKGRHVRRAISPHRRQWQEEEIGDEEMRRRGMNWFWVSKRLIKKLPSPESLQAERGAGGAELLASSLGNESFKRKVEAKQLKLD